MVTFKPPVAAKTTTTSSATTTTQPVRSSAVAKPMTHVAMLANSMKLFIPKFSDNQTIQSMTTQAPANDSVDNEDAADQSNNLSNSDAPSVVDVTSPSKYLSPYYGTNATLVGSDASKMRIDPQTLEAALSAFSASLLLANQWLDSNGQTPAIINFDSSGNYTQGGKTTNNGAYSMSAVPPLTTGLPVLGFLFRITAFQGNLGQSGIITINGVSTKLLPRVSAQQDSANSASYVFIPSAVGAMQNQNAQALALAADGDPFTITDGPSLTQIANYKIVAPQAYAAGATLFNLFGTNATVMILPVFLTTNRCNALKQAILQGKIKTYYDSIVGSAAALFAGDAV